MLFCLVVSHKQCPVSIFSFCFLSFPFATHYILIASFKKHPHVVLIYFTENTINGVIILVFNCLIWCFFSQIMVVYNSMYIQNDNILTSVVFQYFHALVFTHDHNIAGCVSITLSSISKKQKERLSISFLFVFRFLEN